MKRKKKDQSIKKNRDEFINIQLKGRFIPHDTDNVPFFVWVEFDPSLSLYLALFLLSLFLLLLFASFFIYIL